MAPRSWLSDDNEEDKHLFYRFFESRNDPANDPVVLWLNCGPGSIGENIKPIYNDFSNNNASVIFLDQPINVGYSYSGSSVSDTVAAGKDVYALFDPVLQAVSRSVLIGNGLTDGLTQYEYYRPMACGEGGYPAVLDESTCQSMDNSLGRCQSMIESCYNSESSLICRTGQNVYDIRGKARMRATSATRAWATSASTSVSRVRDAVGAEVDGYDSCNFDINRNFLAGSSEALEWPGQKEFAAAELEDLKIVQNEHVGKKIGQIKTHGNFTFHLGAGHISVDQPGGWSGVLQPLDWW
ncbi:hypothetical protein N7499_007664 [Penicillium canescens]|nr:hypothetical protein N7499_007664 [Penicillium canescens]